MSNKVCKHIYLSGRVQGVGCRFYILENAQKLNIKGKVKNLIDGRVEAILAGDRENVEQMLKLAQQGPPLGEVTDIEVIEEEYQGEFEKFKIKY